MLVQMRRNPSQRVGMNAYVGVEEDEDVAPRLSGTSIARTGGTAAAREGEDRGTVLERHRFGAIG
jgi:hypothetical protein